MLVYDPAKDGVDAGALCGDRSRGRRGHDRPRRDHRTRRRLRAAHAAPLRARRRRRAARTGHERRVRHAASSWATAAASATTARARVLDACARGNASIYATGSSPGFITDALPLRAALVATPCRPDRDRRVREPLAARLAAPAVPADGFRAAARSFNTGARRVPPRGVPARARRRSRTPRAAPPTSGRAVGEVAVARETTTLLAGELPAGTVGAQRTTITGRNDGETS